MNILINFSALKSGGGQNVAMNFLLAIDQIAMKEHNIFYLVAKDSDPHKFLASANEKNFVSLPRNPIIRMISELVFGRHWIRNFDIDVVYSYFGYALFPKYVTQVTGSADSNLYFPEIDFWAGYSRVSRFAKRLKDMYRLFGVRRADAVVFENPELMRRAIALYGLQNAKCISPSINFDRSASADKFVDSKTKTIPIGLFLCGWHLNKNVLAIPRLAAEMRAKNTPMLMMVTAPNDGSEICEEFLKQVEKYKVSEFVKLAGTVPKKKLPGLYAEADVVFLLSKLESFSNNIIEAWYFRRPLVISDESWAKSICGKAAYYVNRESVPEIATRTVELLRDSDLRNNIVREGEHKLARFPTITDRIREEIEFLVEVCERA